MTPGMTKQSHVGSKVQGTCFLDCPLYDEIASFLNHFAYETGSTSLAITVLKRIAMAAID